MTNTKKKSDQGAEGEQKESASKQVSEEKPGDDDSGELKPVRPKIGESADNLRQRSEWFQKRSGRS